MKHLPRPKYYPLQYLLIPVRVIMVLPMLAGVIAVSLFIKLFISAIGLTAIGILFGLAWLVDIYLWAGFSNSALAGLFGLLLIYPLWYGVAYCFGGATERVGTIPFIAKTRDPLTKGVGKTWDWIFNFVFEAKYHEPYLEMFGPNFPEPKFSDFNLDKEDYYAYNRRFNFGEWTGILGTFAAIFTMWYCYDERLKGHFQGWGIVAALITGLTVGLLFWAFDLWYAKRFPQHEQVQEYSYAKKVYDSIQETLRKAKFEKEWAAKQALKARLNKAK